jgi:Cytoskeletal-regulatory complex EF hand
MRQTLRKHSPKGADDDDPKRGRKHILRKHPNMHHEGDRKRWRDKISERERKRYEGVWAANRGLLHQHETADLTHQRSKGAASEELVLNVVVRDIWERSRLPRDVLEEIWDLVTEEESRSLNREEFVVGMWLIDQRLKGRKLPVKVSPSVWSSVRHTKGVKISSKPL